MRSDVPLTEFQVNQTIATLVRDQLIALGVDVEMLREFDPKLDGYQSSALVSIHADSCDYINDQATGFKVSAAMSNPRPQLSARLTACLRQRYALTTGLEPHNGITADMTSYHAITSSTKTRPPQSSRWASSTSTASCSPNTQTGQPRVLWMG